MVLGQVPALDLSTGARKNLAAPAIFFPILPNFPARASGMALMRLL